jgi:serine/threonine protein kinase
MAAKREEIRHRGKRYPILDRLQVGSHHLLVLEQLGSHRHPTFRALERGLTHEMRGVHRLPYSRATVDRLNVLSHISAPQSNLPTILDSRRQGDEVVVLTRWIDGPLLRDYLQDCRRGREPWPSPIIVVNLIQGLAHGCRLLHDRLGVVHGDIHPGNLVLCRHTKKLVPIDFGSAWHIERTADRPTGDGAMRAYRAPELDAGGAAPSFRSDQFSIMVVCYEMLTGKIPYDGLSGRAARLSEAEQGRLRLTPASGELRHPGRLPREIGQSLDAVIRQGLALDARQRYPSTRAWHDALNHLSSTLRRTPHATRANQWLLRQLQRLEGWLGPSGER